VNVLTLRGTPQRGDADKRVVILDAGMGVPQQCSGVIADDRGKIKFCCEMLNDDVRQCEVCGFPVFWRRSKRWASLHGKWHAEMERELAQPRDELGSLLLQSLGGSEYNSEPITHFRTAYDLTRWEKIINLMTRDEIREVIKKGRNKRTKVKGRICELRGYGLLNYILNECERIIATRPAQVERRSNFEGLG
jgi:hypothetical protein